MRIPLRDRRALEPASPALLQLLRGQTRPGGPPARRGLRVGAAAVSLVSLLPLALAHAQAGPMHCTTSLEAPIMATRDPAGGLLIPASPVEVTRCVPVETVPELFERRAYTWTSPFARGVDLLHQVTDILGIAMGGGDGTRVMGLGFPDKTLVWDGSAIQNTTHAQLELQSTPMPRRTPDLVSVFNSSLGSGGLMQGFDDAGMLQAPGPVGWQDRTRGLW